MAMQEYTEEQMREARRYALCIIRETPAFRDFAVNMLDYMGEAFCPYLKALYKEHSIFLFNQQIPQDDLDWVDSLDEYEILAWFEDFKQQEEKEKLQRQQNFKENIDELQFLVNSYRQTDEFQKMLDLVGRFRHLAPFNAMLVELQRPGAMMVLSAKDWAELDRMIKPNAQKLIVLRQFGPVQCLFELSDTEPIPGTPATEDSELLEQFNKQLMSAEGDVDPELLQRLIDNLPAYGVYLDTSFNAANTYGGYIMPFKHPIDVPLGMTMSVQYTSQFLISVNRNQSPVDKFQTICHELGHLFCRHQSYDPHKARNLSKKEREFEAETVAWLVCKRHGIKNPSERYLASYAPDGEIPLCSTDYVLKAVTEIEKMLRETVYANKSLWYSDNKDFKNFVNNVRKQLDGRKTKLAVKPKTTRSFNLTLYGLPFEPSVDQVIYIESEYNEKVNRYIRENYYSIKNCFKDSGKEFIYIPKLLEELKDTAILQYNTPYAEGLRETNIGSDFLLRFIEHPGERRNFPPSLVFFCPSTIRKYHSTYPFRGVVLAPDTDYFKCNNLSFALADINRMAISKKSEFYQYYKELSEGIDDGYNPFKIDAERPFDSDVLNMLDEARSIVEKLRLRGVSDYLLEQIIHGEEKLSRLHITSDFRIFLPDYNNTEIIMGPLPKTVFLFYLDHEEGVSFKNLSEYKEDLLNIYYHIKQGQYNDITARQSIDDLTDPLGNSINENCSRIRRAFISKFKEQLARHYFVTGLRSEPKKITLPRHLVEWE